MVVTAANMDHFRSIKQESLQNLRYTRSTNSAMSKMFPKYGLFFDVVQKTMEFEQTLYDVDYSKYRGRCNLYGNDEQLGSIAIDSARIIALMVLCATTIPHSLVSMFISDWNSF